MAEISAFIHWELQDTSLFRFDPRQPTPAIISPENEWFDWDITYWWIMHVLWTTRVKNSGDVNALLIMENCSAHDICMSYLPPRLTINLLPTNVTSKHQPEDMGMIDALKFGYKFSPLIFFSI